MAVTKITQENKVRVPAKTMFEAIRTEPYTALPKVMRNAIKSVEILQGDGGAGTIVQINFHADAPHPYAKYRIDAVDIKNQTRKMTMIEGPVLGEKLESIRYDPNLKDSSDGGCIIKIVSEYRSKGDIQLKDEDIKPGKDEVLVFYSLSKKYLGAIMPVPNHDYKTSF